MNIISKIRIIVAGLLVTLPMQAHTSVSEDNTDVGKIPVQYALSPTGAVTYQVPINVHSAPDGFQPQLSFSYNSQQNESALGYGWTIGGLSAINHVSGSIYYDGKATPLSTSEDKLMLDGMRSGWKHCPVQDFSAGSFQLCDDFLCKSQRTVYKIRIYASG